MALTTDLAGWRYRWFRPSGVAPDAAAERKATRSANRAWWLITGGFAVYLAVVTALLIVDGYFPTVDLLAIAFFPVAVLLRRGKSFLADWIPLVIVLLAYETFRGIASHWYGEVHASD